MLVLKRYRVRSEESDCVTVYLWCDLSFYWSLWAPFNQSWTFFYTVLVNWSLWAPFNQSWTFFYTVLVNYQKHWKTSRGNLNILLLVCLQEPCLNQINYKYWFAGCSSLHYHRWWNIGCSFSCNEPAKCKRLGRSGTFMAKWFRRWTLEFTWVEAPHLDSCLRRVMRRSGKKSSSFRASTVWYNQIMGATASLSSPHMFVQGWR